MAFSVRREHAYQRIENRKPQRASEYVCRCARISIELHATVAWLLGQALSAFSAWLGPNSHCDLYTYPGSFAGRIYSFYTPPSWLSSATITMIGPTTLTDVTVHRSEICPWIGDNSDMVTQVVKSLLLHSSVVRYACIAGSHAASRDFPLSRYVIK
jgi:hypothetical protein